MLEALRITDLGVIADVEVDLAPGLTVVSGETGAGKTMVVTGLQLLFGARADAGRVSTGAAQAVVEGRLLVAPDSPAAATVAAAGGVVEDGELVLRRLLTATGRSRAYAGGAATPVATLAAVGAETWSIHGQADQMRLSQSGEQRATLDRFGGPALGEQLAAYAGAFGEWQDVETALVSRDRDAAALAREADLLQHGLREIEAVRPEPGEDVELDRRVARLGAVEQLRAAARRAHDALVGDFEDLGSDVGDARSLLAGAERQLSGVEDSDPQLADLRSRLSDAAAAVDDVGAELATYLDDLDADPQQLAAAQARRAELAGLVRKYRADRPATAPTSGPDGRGGWTEPPSGTAAEPPSGTAGVLAWADSARVRLAAIDPSDAARAALAQRRDQARNRAAELAAVVRSARREAATRLGAAVTAELAGLALRGAELEVTVTPRPSTAGAPQLTVDGRSSGAGRHGTEEVVFLLRTHPDAPSRPVARSASGGELSRLMLALEVVLAGSDPIGLMVFDEVDSGVGGRAAVEVGRRLAALAERRQVIVVTHLAQVAAFADHHLVVGAVGSVEGSKGAAPITHSDLRQVFGPDRVSELARMLAGSDTEAARRHAGELLDGAAAERGIRAGDSENAVVGSNSISAGPFLPEASRPRTAPRRPAAPADSGGRERVSGRRAATAPVHESGA
ncbi:MAG: DNA repair protein RecN [bacterium]